MCPIRRGGRPRACSEPASGDQSDEDGAQRHDDESDGYQPNFAVPPERLLAVDITPPVPHPRFLAARPLLGGRAPLLGRQQQSDHGAAPTSYVSEYPRGFWNLVQLLPILLATRALAPKEFLPRMAAFCVSVSIRAGRARTSEVGGDGLGHRRIARRAGP